MRCILVGSKDPDGGGVAWLCEHEGAGKRTTGRQVTLRMCTLFAVASGRKPASEPLGGVRSVNGPWYTLVLLSSAAPRAVS